MKQLFTISILFLALSGRGQTDVFKGLSNQPVVSGQATTAIGTLMLNAESGTFSAWNSYDRKFKTGHDTIPRVMLIADTVEKVRWLIEHGEVDATNHICFWQKGYEVRKVDTQMVALYIMPTPEPYYTHESYLTADKKPMTYLVWMAK